MITEREFAVEVVRTLKEAVHEAIFAGGCVRDELLGLTPKDHDVATSAHPEQVQTLFRRTVAVGVSFGVVEVLGPRPHKIQVATFRSDGEYTDARRPDSVTFCSAEEDAKRRDFTINGLFLDPTTGEVFDYVGGREDLKKGILRAIGDPFARFREDRLRLLRAVRIAARFKLTFEDQTWGAIEAMAPQLGDGVSAERIAEELRKILTNAHRSRAIQYFNDLGLAAVVMPEVPGGTSWDRTYRTLQELGEESSFPLAAAVLLSGVGTRTASTICLRLKLANDERERIEWLVERQRRLRESPFMRPAVLKGLLVHPGIDELFALHRADARASNLSENPINHAAAMRQRWGDDGTLNPPPLLTGHDLLEMGVEPGPIFKEILARVREAQLDGTIGTREDAVRVYLTPHLPL